MLFVRYLQSSNNNIRNRNKYFSNNIDVSTKYICNTELLCVNTGFFVLVINLLNLFQWTLTFNVSFYENVTSFSLCDFPLSILIIKVVYNFPYGYFPILYFIFEKQEFIVLEFVIGNAIVQLETLN